MNDADFYEELQDLDLTEAWLTHARKQKHPARNPLRTSVEERLLIDEQDDQHSAVKFSYRAARFEEGWLRDSMADFYEHAWIADVLRRVKGGKEANVYQCKGGAATGAPHAAAKVYRPRSMRNLKNDHLYREGRTDLDEDGLPILKEGELRAIRQRTQYGKELMHQSWIAYEYLALERLHAAGVDVPRPYAMSHNAILMGFVGDELEAAPALSEITLDREEAKALLERTLTNIDLMLSEGVIHGDLSAYNILYWEGRIALIDFPQFVQPGSNLNAYVIFRRDVTRVCEYFARQGLRVDGRALAEQIWRDHGHKLRHEVHPLHLDAEKAEDRAVWERQRRGQS